MPLIYIYVPAWDLAKATSSTDAATAAVRNSTRTGHAPGNSRPHAVWRFVCGRVPLRRTPLPASCRAPSWRGRGRTSPENSKAARRARVHRGVRKPRARAHGVRAWCAQPSWMRQHNAVRVAMGMESPPSLYGPMNLHKCELNRACRASSNIQR